MDPEEKENLKHDIEKKIAVLRTRISELERSSGPVAPDNAIGRLTRMEAIQSAAMGQAGLERFRRELHDLEEKLAAIDSTGFGRCRMCSGPIGVARLKALPATDTCIQCAQKYS
jgi:DnaK suppressor protein